MNLWKAIKSFFKIGVIGFGGGTALIPVVEKEAVEDKKLISQEKFKEDMVLQGITPGAFPIKVGANVGLYHSSYGSALVAYAVSAFGAVIAIAITAILTLVSAGVLEQIKYLSVGISAFIVLVIYKFIVKIPKQAKKESFLPFALCLMVFSMLFSCSGKLEDIIALFSGKQIKLYISELSTAMVLLLGVVFVFFTGLKTKITAIQAVKYIIATIVTVLSILSFSKDPIINLMPLNIILYFMLSAMFVYAIAEDVISAKRKAKKEKELSNNEELSGEKSDVDAENNSKLIKRALIAVAILLTPFIIMTVVAFVLPLNTEKSIFAFIGNSILSVITTFGGGTAYISVAEGIFVGGGYITGEFFVNQATAIANALPGPLLVKMLGSIYFDFGMNSGLNMAGSIYFGLYGSVLGITITTVAYLLIFVLFEKVKGLTIFNTIKKGILPLIAGLLVPTILMILANMIKVTMLSGINVWFSLLFVTIIMTLCSVCVFKTKLKDPVILIIFGVITIGSLNLIKLI